MDWIPKFNFNSYVSTQEFLQYKKEMDERLKKMEEKIKELENRSKVTEAIPPSPVVAPIPIPAAATTNHVVEDDIEEFSDDEPPIKAKSGAEFILRVYSSGNVVYLKGYEACMPIKEIILKPIRFRYEKDSPFGSSWAGSMEQFEKVIEKIKQYNLTADTKIKVINMTKK